MFAIYKFVHSSLSRRLDPTSQPNTYDLEPYLAGDTWFATAGALDTELAEATSGRRWAGQTRAYKTALGSMAVARITNGTRPNMTSPMTHGWPKH